MTNRRLFLQMGPPAAASFALATCSRTLTNSSLNSPPNQPTQSQALSPTPSCTGDETTPPQTAGPFYTPKSPERASLREPGITGTPIVLAGRVLSRSCEPVANALLDFWHTDDQGQYDNSGYKLRGHQFTDTQGRYRLETIIPGIYPGRTRHFHVKVQVANQTPITTQLYFPEEALNGRDGLFQPELLIAMNNPQAAEQTEQQAEFDFVV
ncbi:MAG: hypothetical protein ACFB0D_11225 [Phormidesmis sp.]